MAKCKYCNREMLTADGCGCTAYLVHGKKVPTHQGRRLARLR